MSRLTRDLRQAVRSLIRAPTFTVASVLALSLAIGAHTSVYGVIHALQSFPVPVADPDRVAFLFQDNPEQRVQQGGISVDDFLDYRQELAAFEQLVLAAPQPFSVEGAEQPVRVQGVRVTPEFFEVLDIHPVEGRGLRPDVGDGADREVVISHAFWQSSFGGAPVLGLELRLDGTRHTVVGVAPEGFFFLNPRTAVWAPLRLERGASPRDRRAQVAFGRLAPGVGSQQATIQAKALADRLAAEYPATNRAWTASVLTLEENLNQGTRFVRVLLYASITFVLLIACVNVANLLLARSLTQEREMALRVSLGAPGGRLVRRQLVESLVLAVFSGLLGILFGAFGIELLRTWIAPDPNVGFIAEWMQLDAWVALHALGISVLAGLLFGTTPALQAASKVDLGDLLKDGQRGGDSGRRQLLRSGLVMGEVALALALLITSATLIRAFQAIYEADPGFDTSRLLTLQVMLPEEDYPDSASRARFFEQVRQKVETLPGVEGVVTTTVLPLTRFAGAGTCHAELEGEERVAEDRAPNVDEIVVSPGYFETLGIGLRRGRTFEARDRADGQPVALVNETFVERFFNGEDPLDRRVRLTSPDHEEPGPWRRIVGVVENHGSHAHSLRRPSRQALVFMPEGQDAREAVTFVARTRGEPTASAVAAREAVWEVDPRLPVDPVQSLEQAVAQVDTQNIFFLRILSGLALVAFLLAAVGIYGIVAYSVGRRTREIGIRAALGARPGVTVRWITGQAARLTAVGLVVGAAIAWMLVRFMSNQLEGIGHTRAGGPGTFLVVAGGFLVVAVVSSAWPALRAARIDPVRALRED